MARQQTAPTTPSATHLLAVRDREEPEGTAAFAIWSFAA